MREEQKVATHKSVRGCGVFEDPVVAVGPGRHDSGHGQPLVKLDKLRVPDHVGDLGKVDRRHRHSLRQSRCLSSDRLTVARLSRL